MPDLNHRSPGSRWRRVVAAVLAPLLPALAFVAWIALAPTSLHAACREDGSIETATAVAFLAGAAGFAAAAGRGRPSRSGRRVLLVLASVASVVFFGEEISWGQRILGFETPAPLRAINAQGEFNVHNVGALQRMKYTLLVLTVGAVGLGLPLLRIVPPLRRAAARVGLPLPTTIETAAFLASLFFLRHAANWMAMEWRNDAQEIGELFFALGLAAFGLHAAVRLEDLVDDPSPAPVELSRPPPLPGAAPPPAATGGRRPAERPNATPRG